MDSRAFLTVSQTRNTLVAQSPAAQTGTAISNWHLAFSDFPADDYLTPVFHRILGRAEKLGSSLGVMAAVFYFMPFVITVLVVVGVPLISTITGN